MANRPDLATVLYRDAVARLPFYVVANTHLAELESGSEAMARLAQFVDAGDPEPSARLADRLSELDPTRSSELREQAEAGYEVLLLAQRAAFLDHAAEFYISAGDDPGRALALSLENLELRPTARAFVVAIQAAEQAHDAETLCQLINQCVPLRPQHRVLDALVTDHEGLCLDF